MYLYTAVGLLSLSLSVGLTWLVRRAALRFGMVDLPDGFRKIHAQAKPRLGGVAVYAAFFISLFVAAIFRKPPMLVHYLAGSDFLAFFGCATAAFLVGLGDDVFRLRARHKLLLLTLVSVAVFLMGYRIDMVSNPFGEPFHLGYLALPVTLFWFLGCMNAMNLIDGIDGLAGGVAVFAGGTMLVASHLLGNSLMCLLAAGMVGATIGFLFFNFHPASIMLGDSGSYLLGFLIAAIGLRGVQKASTVVALVVPVVAMGLPVMDTALAIARRWFRGLPLSAADRQHIHHRLLNMGLTRRQAVLVMYGACLLLAGFALLIMAANGSQKLWLLLALAMLLFVAIKTVATVEIALLKERMLRRFGREKRTRDARASGYEAAERMGQGQSIEALWAIFSQAAGELEVDSAKMSLRIPNASPRDFVYTAPPDVALDRSGGKWIARLPLRAADACWGELETTKSVNGLPLEPVVPEMLHLLGSAMAQNIARLGQTSSEGKLTPGGRR